MKVYRTIVIVLASILGISFTIASLFNPAAQTAIKEPVTEEYYAFLKENALNLAKTLDKNVVTDETLTANYFFNEDELVITVESTKAELIAEIPFSDYSYNAENETIIAKGTADFGNIKYTYNINLPPFWVFIVGGIVGGISIFVLIYGVLFEIIFHVIHIIFDIRFSHKKQ